jgi:prolipoprotein diacylglyceryltransferase
VRFPLYDGPFAPPRYPTQLLESLVGFIILGSLFFFDKLLGKENRPRGALSAIFLIMYFLGRFLVEFWKERQGDFDNFYLSRGQLLSIIPFTLGVLLLLYVLYKHRKGELLSVQPIKKANSKPKTTKPQNAQRAQSSTHKVKKKMKGKR